MKRVERVLIPFGAWLALSVLASACSPVPSASAPTAEAPAQACAIAYPEPEPSAPDQAQAVTRPEQEGKEANIESAPRPLIPPIDAIAPAKTERATLALG